MAEITIIRTSRQKRLALEVGHRLEKNSAVPFPNPTKYIDVRARILPEVLVKFDSNFMINEDAISKIGWRVNIDKSRPLGHFAIQLYIVTSPVLIAHVAQPFVYRRKTIAHCIRLKAFIYPVYGTAMGNSAFVANENAS